MKLRVVARAPTDLMSPPGGLIHTSARVEFRRGHRDGHAIDVIDPAAGCFLRDCSCFHGTLDSIDPRLFKNRTTVSF